VKLPRLPWRGPPKGGNPDEVYLALRGRVLGTVPSEIGIAPTSEAPHVWGVVLEMALARGTATVVALADGTSSLYTSTGGGVIGGGSHQRVAVAARNCVREAETALDEFPPVDVVPLPGADRTALVTLTYGGPRRVEWGGGPLAVPDERILTVYAAAQAVITELRQI
jgi:hypothetical protein